MTVTLSSCGEEFTIDVNANIEYDVECNADWITLTNNGDSWIIIAAENLSSEERTTVISFVGKNNKDVEASVTIHQVGYSES